MLRLHARDLHLAREPGEDGDPFVFPVEIDGKPPGDSHRVDSAASGAGLVTQDRLLAPATGVCTSFGSK